MEDSKLSDLRKKIDLIDAELLQLLSRRAELVLEVGRLKHEAGCSGNFIRSGREASMIRNLTAKGAGNFPKAAIYSLWRSIICASLSLESDIKVALPQNNNFVFNQLVIEYFGSFTQYTQYGSDEEILDAVDKHTIAVLTLESGWWLNLAEEKHRDLKIFAKLADGVFAVAKVQPEESGDDRTIVITHADEHKGQLLATHGKVKLVEFSGFHKELNEAVVIGNYGL